MENRTKIIVAILETTSEYKVGNVSFEVKNKYVEIQSTKENNTFYATNLCTLLSAFTMYIKVVEGKAILTVY